MRARTWCWTILVSTLLTGGCQDGSDDDSSADDDTSMPSDDDTAEVDPFASIALREDGWLRGDLHMHTTYSDGFDDVATVVALAEYYENETFLAHHPEFEGDWLDFISITDHESPESQEDPGFVSDQLLLIGGEELSVSGHANRWGITEHAIVDVDGDGRTLEDVQAVVASTHDAGGVFSMNHPMIAGIPFLWDVRTHDAMEVWNMGWALASGETTEEDVTSWEASHAPASVFAERAVQHRGITSSGQSLVMYEAFLSRGVHTAVVGGSDRHALVLLGTPATYVRADGSDVGAVLDGIRARHTFVARNPGAAQVLVELTVDGASYEAGDDIPVPAGGTTATVSVRVGRADGGELRWVFGHALPTDAEVATAPLGEIDRQDAIIGHDATFEAQLDVHPGDWFYPIVLEPLVPPSATPEQAELVEELAAAAMLAGDDPMEVAETLAPVIGDIEILGDPDSCDPEDWQPDELQCVTIIEEGMASFYIPDLLDRAMNVYVQDDSITEWTVGALASAVRFTAE